MKTDGILYNYQWHYNPYTEKWSVVHRDFSNELYNGGDNVISSSNPNTLIKIILRTKGDFSKIEELVNETNDE